MRPAIIFSSEGNTFHTFATVKEQILRYGFNIWYTISYTHVTQKTIDTAISTSDIYDIRQERIQKLSYRGVKGGQSLTDVLVALYLHFTECSN